jgi:hypothetical protein
MAELLDAVAYVLVCAIGIATVIHGLREVNQ